MKQRNYIMGMIAALGMAASLGSCMRDANDPGIQYAPEMVESIPFDPFKQVSDSTSPFRNGQVMQVPPDGTIPRGGHAAFGIASGDSAKLSPAVLALANPVALDATTLEEGKVLYTRFCAVCHGSKGNGEGGDGQVAKHDAISPPDLNSGKWVTYAPGQIYHTIMYGQGVMGSYASQLDHDERWKVVHYVISLRPTTTAAPAADSAATEAVAPAADAKDAKKAKDNKGGH